jgi:hypothetical protein
VHLRSADARTHRRFRTLVPAILVLFAISAAFRWSRREEAVVDNIDASYHVLLTVRALNETPAAVHHFLPIVTLGRAFDRDVPFGATTRGPLGIYYYTSFPPLGFVAPWAFFRITKLAPNIEHLLVFNLAIHLVATLLLALLIHESATSLDGKRATHAALVLLAAATYLFTFEALYSHGIIYWHHSLFQVVWLTQLIAAARVFRAADNGAALARRDVTMLLAASVYAPAVEWTGYLTSAVIAWRCDSRGVTTGRRELRRLGAWVLVCPVAAGIAFVIHFASVIGMAPLLDGLRARAHARSADFGFILRLGKSYVDSFGALVVLVPVALGVYVTTVRRRPATWIVTLIIVAALPLVENVLLAEHATSYHFDRLKALIPIVMVAAISIALLPARLQTRLLVVWLLVVGWNVKDLRRSRTIGASIPKAANASLMRRVRAVAKPCAVYATNVEARGWVELSFGANAYENILTVDSAASLVRARGACQGLYFRVARDLGQDMYVWRDVLVIDPSTGAVERIDLATPADGREPGSPRALDQAVGSPPPRARESRRSLTSRAQSE